MRRSDHPSCPSAMTCCFFPSLKTLLTLTEGNPHVRTMSRISESVGRFSGDHHWPVLGDPRGGTHILEPEFIDRLRTCGALDELFSSPEERGRAQRIVERLRAFSEDDS